MSHDFQKEIAWLGATSSPVFVRAPEGHGRAGVAEPEGRGLVEELVPHAAVERLADAVSRLGLPGAMKCQGTLAPSDQARIAFEVGSAP
jgi:hypothetical protein